MKKSEIIKNLILEGKSYSEIIEVTGASESTIWYHSKKLGNPNKPDFTEKNLLAKSLILENLDNKTVSEKSGLCIATICKIRKQLNIPSATNPSQSRKISDKIQDFDWSEVQNFHNQGNSYSKCKNHFGISKAVLKLATREKLLVPTKKKSSPVWAVSSENFRQIVESSNTYGEILENFGLANRGNNQQTVKDRLKAENIAFVSKKNYKLPSNTKNVLDYLFDDTKIGSFSLKNKLIKEGLFKNECIKCGLGSTWQGEPISLQLDHINGKHTDNRIENLRILCPNCHSQTNTWGNRSKRKAIDIAENTTVIPIARENIVKVTPIKTFIACMTCGINTENNMYCSRKCASTGKFKIALSTEDMYQTYLDNDKNLLATSRAVGMSDNGLRKRFKRAGLI